MSTLNEIQAANIPHSLKLDLRSRLDLCGIIDVVSFDEVGAVLQTTDGLLSVDGEGLHMTSLNLDDGRVALEGRINALVYIDSQKDAKKRRK